MPILQEIDKTQNPYMRTLYYGNGFQKTPKAFYDSDTDDDEYSGSGFMDLVSAVGRFVGDNKDTIQAIAYTAGKVLDTGKAISETVKASNEVKKLEQIAALRKTAKRKKLPPDAEAAMIGSGFATFRR